MKDDIRGEVAVVTGASRGLGLLLARELARHGCPLVICARDAAELERAAGDLRAGGAEVTAVALDVTEDAAPQRLVDTALERYGRLDIVLSNAGIIQVGPVQADTAEQLQTALATMALAPARLALAALPVMREQGHGRIVTITSIGGKLSVPHLLPYSTAKFAAVGFSEGLRAELGRGPVTVTTVVPGLMRTGSHLNARFTGRAEPGVHLVLPRRQPAADLHGRRAGGPPDRRGGPRPAGRDHPDPGRAAGCPAGRAGARPDQPDPAPGAATGPSRTGRRTRAGNSRVCPEPGPAP